MPANAFLDCQQLVPGALAHHPEIEFGHRVVGGQRQRLAGGHARQRATGAQHRFGTQNTQGIDGEVRFHA